MIQKYKLFCATAARVTFAPSMFIAVLFTSFVPLIVLFVHSLNAGSVPPVRFLTVKFAAGMDVALFESPKRFIPFMVKLR